MVQSRHDVQLAPGVDFYRPSGILTGIRPAQVLLLLELTILTPERPLLASFDPFWEIRPAQVYVWQE